MLGFEVGKAVLARGVALLELKPSLFKICFILAELETLPGLGSGLLTGLTENNANSAQPEPEL